VALTVAELPAYLAAQARKAGDRSPAAAANGMAQAYQSYVVRSMRGPAPSPPGTPPARRSGTLARSVRPAPAVPSGAYRATASIAPHTVYARIQQAGGTIRAKHTTPDGRPGYLRFEIGGRVLYRHQVTLPPRPYMVLNSAVDGEMRDGAIAGLEASGALLGG
jgi:hypothetical protein